MTAVLVSGIIAYTGTNIDGMFLLVGLLAADPDHSADILCGLYLGMVALVLGAILCSDFAPSRFVGLLGAIPVGIGLVRLAIPQKAGMIMRPPGTAMGTLPVAMLIIASGGDNLAVYIPLFAAQTMGGKLLLAMLFLMLTAIWFLAARLLAQHAAGRLSTRRGASRFGPLVLVSLGLCLLLRSGGLGLAPAVSEFTP